jgi:hypothetical protein
MVLNISKNIHKIACINIVVANKKSILWRLRERLITEGHE